jgi:hypothetical protein
LTFFSFSVSIAWSYERRAKSESLMLNALCAVLLALCHLLCDFRAFAVRGYIVEIIRRPGMNVLGISGSPNEGGNTAYAVRYALDALGKDGIDIR